MPSTPPSAWWLPPTAPSPRFPREDYLEAEERVIGELKELGKPFLVLLNSAYPDSERARAIRDEIAQRYQVTCVTANCLTLGEEDISALLRQVLYEFPLKELDLYLPPWVDALPQEHPIKAALYAAIRQGAKELRRIRDVEQAVGAMGECQQVSQARISAIDLAPVWPRRPWTCPGLFYETCPSSRAPDWDDGD